MERDIFGKIVDSPKIIKDFKELLELKEVKAFLAKGNWMINHKIMSAGRNEFYYFIESQGIYIAVHPEFYSAGINWNWQLWWYLPQEQWSEHRIEAGTYLYGDNNEYPTREIAELSAFHMAIRLIEAGMPVGKAKE